VLTDALMMRNREEIVQLATRQRIPGLYTVREFVDAGGLMSYGADNNALFYRAAEYADRILRGEKGSALPIEQATKFELVVNLRTAKVLGVVIPQSVLLRTDDVIK
jgi:putative tryptophan/tyrosine transport system substrate-binding protein